MLIAKSDRPAETLSELIREVRGRVQQFADSHADEVILPGHETGFLRLLVGIGSLIASALLWVGVVFLDSGALRFGCAGLALLFGLYNRIDDRLQKKRIKRFNAGAKVGLGGLVQANDALFERENEDPLWGLAVVTMDEELQAQPERLMQLAEYIYALAKEGLEPVPDFLQEVVARTRSEKVHFEDPVLLPREFTGNDDTWLYDLLFLPEHLPRGCVARSLWPVIFHADEAEVGAQVPSKDFWWNQDVDHLFYLEDENGAACDEGALESKQLANEVAGHVESSAD